jgi:CxC1 like cysteine cluster associated with KDZ transposases
LRVSINAYYLLDHKTIDVQSCRCWSLASVLIDHGFFLTAPHQPRLAISIDFLELYHTLFEHTGDAVATMSAALSKLYARRGYPINNAKVNISYTYNLSVALMKAQGEPIKDPFRRAFGSVVQWYDCLKVTVRRSVEKAIEQAHDDISGFSQPTLPGSPERPMPDVPLYYKLFSTHAARLLQKPCMFWRPHERAWL